MSPMVRKHFALLSKSSVNFEDNVTLHHHSGKAGYATETSESSYQLLTCLHPGLCNSVPLPQSNHPWMNTRIQRLDDSGDLCASISSSCHTWNLGRFWVWAYGNLTGPAPVLHGCSFLWNKKELIISYTFWQTKPNHTGEWKCWKIT